MNRGLAENPGGFTQESQSNLSNIGKLCGILAPFPAAPLSAAPWGPRRPAAVVLVTSSGPPSGQNGGEATPSLTSRELSLLFKGQDDFLRTHLQWLFFKKTGSEPGQSPKPFPRGICQKPLAAIVYLAVDGGWIVGDRWIIVGQGTG